MKIVSGVLILITAFLNFKHGWEGLTMNVKPGDANLMTELGLGKTTIRIIGILSLAVGFMVLIPQTFFIGNLVSAAIILFIMALALRVGNIKIALMEIPFLFIPLLLIWLGHPLK
jgi:hypothetical protein